MKLKPTADERYMEMAIEKARQGIEQGQSPFGACIIRDGEILSCSHNSVIADRDTTAHAEVNAIRRACKKLDAIDMTGATIYSTCEPCPMCFSACHWAKISTIVYGAAISDAQANGFSELIISDQKLNDISNAGIKIVPDFMRDQCVKLFEIWAQREDKQVY